MAVAAADKIVRGADLQQVGAQIKSALAGKQDVIQSVQVTVDNNTGTPSASGSISGSTLSLSFQNLKGAQGPKGDTGATGPQGPQGPQGEQGNTGSSVDYPFELANNLTTDDATKALSAAQGKVLNDTKAGILDSINAEADFEISDETGYLLARFKDGGFRVKNFDTDITNANLGVSDVPDFDETATYNRGAFVKYEGLLYVFVNTHAAGAWDSADVERVIVADLGGLSLDNSGETVDFEVADAEGNILARLKSGHVKTKYFDSEELKADQTFWEYYHKGGQDKDVYTKKVCVLVAGQSNARGATRETMPTELSEALPLDNIHFVENLAYTQQSYDSATTDDFYSFSYSQPGRYLPDRWGFDAYLYYYISTRANQEAYVIKTSQGDTSIDPDGSGTGHWTADYEDVADGDIKLARCFEKNVKAHVKSNPNLFDIRAIVWHQGEGDRDSGPGSRYYDNLKNMVAFFRGVAGNPTLPFITATVSTNSTQWTSAVQEAQEQLADEDPNFHLIDVGAAPLQTSYDTVHFNATACQWIGGKVYDIMVDLGIVDGEKINAARPW